jgi:hypothetical protein
MYSFYVMDLSFHIKDFSGWTNHAYLRLLLGERKDIMLRTSQGRNPEFSESAYITLPIYFVPFFT